MDESHGSVDEKEVNKEPNPMASVYPDMNFINPDELVMGHIIQNDSKRSSRHPEVASGCIRANCTRNIFWKDPQTVSAALVTCGGICPGLNSIIREVTNCLWHHYGVRRILGIPAGYNGLSRPQEFPPIELTPSLVQDIHMKGGSILKAARGGFDADVICENLQKLGVNLLFTVGGDGTLTAADLLFKKAKERKQLLSIVGIPKSIDNDVVLFDKTFGFDSAVVAATDVIFNAYTEATSCDKGVGIVKLMGRDAGFVAMYAALASTLTDLVMIPEVSVKIEDVLAHVDATLAQKDFMVIAVAEGAGQEYVATDQKDATGHTVYGDIGVFLRDAVNRHLKANGGRSFYIDPSYIIRSGPARPIDHVLCMRLAHDAVHTAMRGYTGVCVGSIHNIIVVVPLHLIANRKRTVDVNSSSWQSCVQCCNMPRALSGTPK